MPSYQIDLVLQEPATFGESPAVGNDVATLDFIPSTALRGALAAALARRTPQDQIESRLQACFGEVFPRWTPAFPVTVSGNRLCVPIPACWVEEKDDPTRGFHNTAHGAPPEDRSWRRASRRWLAIDRDGIPAAAISVPKGNHMHLALHYGRQSHREQQLFSRSGIESEGAFRFRAFVADPNGVLQPAELVRELYLGKRRSAGNGRATLNWKTISDRFWPNNPPDGKAVLVQLMTDAIVPGGSGGLLRSLAREAFTGSNMLNIEVDPVASSSHEDPGWSTKWRLPRESALAVAAGSVFRLKSNQPDFASWLEALSVNGIGLRRNEGFGWVAVNPAWLSLDRFPIKADSNSGGEPLDWPGIPMDQEGITPDEHRRRLRHIRNQAEHLHQKTGGQSALSRQRLRAIAAFSQRVTDTSALLAFLNQMAERKNTREWDQTRDALAGTLREDCGSIHEARFFLEAAVTYSPEE
jgi:CRISPR-associated protein Csx10